MRLHCSFCRWTCVPSPLDELGEWNVTVTTVMVDQTTNSRTFTVSVVTQALLSGYYGYRYEGIPDNTTLGNLASFDIELIEARINASDIESEWSKVKPFVERCNELI